MISSILLFAVAGNRIFSYLKIVAVSSTSYISFPLSLVYLFFIHAVWLDEIKSGNMSFNRAANVIAKEDSYRPKYTKKCLLCLKTKDSKISKSSDNKKHFFQRVCYWYNFFRYLLFHEMN